VVDYAVYARRPKDADMLIPPIEAQRANWDEHPIWWPRTLASTPPRTRQLRKQRGDPTGVVRIFPNEASCLRLVRALAAEQHETWQEDDRYLNMAMLAEHKKEKLKVAA
jgi:transposase-like protein